MDNKTIMAALYKAQQLVTSVTKNAKNPHYKSNYANLEAVIEATRGPLAECELCIATMPAGYSDGIMQFDAMLIHSSGAVARMAFALPLSKPDPQGALGALTYARRYAIISWLNLVVEDDDGNTASNKPAVSVPAPVTHTVDSIIAGYAKADLAAYELLTEASKSAKNPKILDARQAAKVRLGAK